MTTQVGDKQNELLYFEKIPQVPHSCWMELVEVKYCTFYVAKQPTIVLSMALHSLYCADVPLRNCSLTHSLLTRKVKISWKQIHTF